MEPVPELVLGVLNYLKAPLISHSTTRDVKTALFSRGHRYYLIVVNNGNEDKSATIHLPALDEIRGKMTARDLISGEKTVYSKEGRCPINIHVSRKDGRILEFTFACR
jgi:hypothetical protein